MRVEVKLTPQESESLIFEQGDYFVIRCGSLSISKKVRARRDDFPDEVVATTFFLDELSGETSEHMGYFLEPPQEGPTLLVQYCRNQQTTVFGTVHFGTRAWTHIVPFSTNPFILESSRFRQIRRLQTTSLVKGMLSPEGLKASVFAMLPLGLGVKKAHEIMDKERNVKGSRDTEQAVEAAVRGFMHRLSRDAERFWPSGPSSSGRL